MATQLPFDGSGESETWTIRFRPAPTPGLDVPPPPGTIECWGAPPTEIIVERADRPESRDSTEPESTDE